MAESFSCLVSFPDYFWGRIYISLQAPCLPLALRLCLDFVILRFLPKLLQYILKGLNNVLMMLNKPNLQCLI